MSRIDEIVSKGHKYIDKYYTEETKIQSKRRYTSMRRCQWEGCTVEFRVVRRKKYCLDHSLMKPDKNKEGKNGGYRNENI